MKHFTHLITLALALCCCGSLCAQRTMQQYINRDIQSITVGGLNNVAIHFGDTNKVEVEPGTASDDLTHIISVSNKDALSVKPGSNNIILTLKPGALTSIAASDNASVIIDELSCPVFSASAENIATLSIYKIVADSMQIDAENSATVNVEELQTSKYTNAYATNLANIRLGRLTTCDATLSADNNATIIVVGGEVKGQLNSTSYNLANIECNASCDQRQMSHVGTPENISKSNCYPQYQFGVRSLWGFHNWGDQMMNGLQGMNGAYGIRTSFSNYQLELANRLDLSPNWSLSLGVGWESDCYKFRNHFVAMETSGTTGNLTVWDKETLAANGLDYHDLSQWDSRMVARYITIPFTVSYTFPNSEFSLSIGVVPGFNFDGKKTGLRHNYKSDGYKYSDSDDMGDYLNPFKCDLRLMVGYSGVGFFIQVPTMPVNRNMDTELFPFKFGFVI